MGKRRNKRTAYHEAGHAVACLLRGVVFRWVEIFDHPRLPSSERRHEIPEELKRAGYDSKRIIVKVWGRVKYSRTNQRWSVLDDIMIRLSGPMCENIRYKESAIRTFLNHRLEIMAIQHDYGSIVPHWRRIEAIIKQPEIWGCVEAVAKELLIRKRIPYAEATRIIEDAFSSNDNHPDEKAY